MTAFEGRPTPAPLTAAGDAAPLSRAINTVAPVLDTPRPHSAAGTSRVQILTLFRDHPLLLDSGQPVSGVRVAYHTYGEPRPEATLVAHALTGTSAVHEWWGAVFGPGRALDPEQQYVVCSNVLGGCAGSTGASELGDAALTLRDMVAVQRELMRVLGVSRVTVVGGSMGGMQVYEWLRSYPDLVRRAVVIGAPARHSPWATGLNVVARGAIRLAPGGEGLKLARQVATLSYRSPGSLAQTQSGESRQRPGTPAVETYLQHQGEKLQARFCEHSYCALTEAMDRFSLSDDELRAVRVPVLVVGISSDVLYPEAEVRGYAALLPRAEYWQLDSPHGHDAFLMDAAALNDRMTTFLLQKTLHPGPADACYNRTMSAPASGATPGLRQPDEPSSEASSSQELATAPNPESRPVSPETLYALQFPSDAQLSPDGERVAFVLTRVGEQPGEADPDGVARPRYLSRIQLSGGGPARDLSSGEGRDFAPVWSPDGAALAFLSDRGGDVVQLFVLPLGGGEARQLTRFKTGVSSPAFSPDGRFLSFLSCGDDLDKRDERGEARAITSLRYRFNGRGMLPGRPASLYLHDLGSGETRVWYSPSLDITDHVWTPDGRGVLYVSSLSDLDAASWRQEVFALDVGAAQPRQLTRWAAPIGNLAPHPDGARFAGIGRPPGVVNTEDPHVYLFGADGEGQRLDAGWDYPAGNLVAGDLHVGNFPDRPTWQGDKLSVLYTVGGSVGLFEVTLAGQVRARLHDEAGVITGFTQRGARLAHIFESAARPTEVYLNGQQVSDCAAQLPFSPVAPVRVTFHSELGEGEGWVLLPPGGEAAPALLNIHGGPHTAYGHGFMHEFQLYAHAGYAVCYSNPRGSVGYGQRWSEDIRGRWGTVDLADLLAFFDAALLAEPRLDAARTGIMGGSYGGYMTNLITSRTPRFQVAVTDRSICNLISFGGTSDIGMRFWDDELGGNFQRSADAPRLWDLSPLKYVEQVKTPTLIIHSLEDLRCPIEQAEQWFAGLQLHGVPSRFVRFPGENHELSRAGRPDRRARRLQEYLDWLDRYLKA